MAVLGLAPAAQKNAAAKVPPSAVVAQRGSETASGAIEMHYAAAKGEDPEITALQNEPAALSPADQSFVDAHLTIVNQPDGGGVNGVTSATTFEVDGVTTYDASQPGR